MTRHGQLSFSTYDYEDWDTIKHNLGLMDFDPYEPDWSERRKA